MTSGGKGSDDQTSAVPRSSSTPDAHPAEAPSSSALPLLSGAELAGDELPTTPDGMGLDERMKSEEPASGDFWAAAGLGAEETSAEDEEQSEVTAEAGEEPATLVDLFPLDGEEEDLPSDELETSVWSGGVQPVWDLDGLAALDVDLATATSAEAPAFVRGPAAATPASDAAAEPSSAGAQDNCVSTRLRSASTAVSRKRPQTANPEAPVEHRVLEPRPFLESLRRNPRDRASLDALRRIFSANAQWEDLINVLLDQADRTDQPTTRAKLLEEVARLFDEALADPQKAFWALVAAFRAAPEQHACADQLTRLVMAHRLWPQLFEEVCPAAAGESQPQRRVSFYARLGDWYAWVGRLDFARLCYEEVLRIEPSAPRALSGMALLLEHAGQRERCHTLVQRIAPNLPSDTPADLLLRVAGLRERHGDLRGAVRLLDQLLEARPDHARALDLLQPLCEKLGEWEELAQRLHRAAEKKAESCHDPEVIGAFWRREVLVRAQHTPTAPALELACRRALELCGADVVTWRVLADVLRSQERWGEWVGTCDSLVAATSDLAEKVELLLRLAACYRDQIGDPDAATETWLRVLELDASNEQARSELVRELELQGQWAEVAELYERLALQAGANAAKVRWLLQAATVWGERCDQWAKAETLLRQAERQSPEVATVFEALGGCLRRQGRPAEALDCYRRQARLASLPRERAQALVRASRLARSSLGDQPAALELLEEAALLDPSCVEAALELAQAKIAQLDLKGARVVLDRALEHSLAPEARGELWLALGHLLREHLEQPLSALEAFEQARVGLGDRREALLSLLETYASQERHAEAHQTAQRLAAISVPAEPEVAARDACRCAEVCLRVGDDDGAILHLERALAVHPGQGKALSLLAELYEQQERWAEARRVLVQWAASGSEELPGWALQARLGRVAKKAGHVAEARLFYESVLAEQPAHPEASWELADLAEARGDDAHALNVLEAVHPPPPGKEADHWRRIALLAEKIDDRARGERALRAWAAVSPLDQEVWRRLLALYLQEGAWSEAIDALGQCANALTDAPAARAQCFLAAAHMCRDKFGDVVQAVEWYEKALGEDWQDLEEFQSWQESLAQLGEQGLQERLYLRVIERRGAQGPPEVLARLWKELGSLYEKQPARQQEAAQAYAAALSLVPDSVELHLALAGLCLALGREDEAFQHHRQALRRQPCLVGSLRALGELGPRVGARHWAFAGVASLAAHNLASEVDLARLDRALANQPWTCEQGLEREDWLHHLLHPDHDPELDALFETLLPAVLPWHQRSLRQARLTSAVRKSPDGASDAVTDQYHALAQALGVTPVPRLVGVEGRSLLVSHAVVEPRSVTFDRSATGLPEDDRAFLFCCALAHYVGGSYVTVLFPEPAQLEALLDAVLAVTDQPRRSASHSSAGAMTTRLRRALASQPELLEQLRGQGARWGSRAAEINLARWLLACKKTACRAGLLLVGDPRVAARALQRDSHVVAPLTLDDSVADLLTYVVSADFCSLREKLQRPAL